MVLSQIAVFTIFYTVFGLKHVGNVLTLNLILKDRRVIPEITCATLCSNRVYFRSWIQAFVSKKLWNLMHIDYMV